jgi:amidase
MAGNVSGLPVGLSFLGPPWSEPALIALGYAFEQAAPPRLAPSLAGHAPASGHAGQR